MTDSRHIEKLETLDGSRGRGAIGKAAVRLQDLAPLLELPAGLKSVKASAAPTKAEFNALVDDVAALNGRLQAVAKLLQARLLP